MPIPNADRAVVPIQKIMGYLLNPLHPVGGPKAEWLLSLGYRSDFSEELAADLLAIVRSSNDFTSQLDPFGVKYAVEGWLNTPSGRRVRVLTIWIIENEVAFPRLVSAYPMRN